MADVAQLAVRQVKQEPKCKLCKSPHRAEIDEWLLKRSNRVVLDGVTINGDFVRARAVELGVENPTHENFTNHWKNHCAVVDRDEEAEIAAAVTTALASMSPEEVAALTAGDALHLLRTQALLELQARLKKTGKTGLSPDQLLRVIEMEQRQKQNEDQRRFLGALGAGLVTAIEKAHQPKALPPAHPDLEAEVVREPEGVSA